MSSYFSHLFGVPYLLVTVRYGTQTAEFQKIRCGPMGTSASVTLAAKKTIHMHIGGATLIAQREGNVSPLMQDNIKEEEMGKEHDVNKEIKLSGERRKRGGGCI